MAGAHVCPYCGLLNAPEAIVCDCGYNFDLGRVPDEVKQPPLGFLSVLFSFHGRINRSTFWLSILPTQVIAVVWILLLSAAAADESGIIFVLFPFGGLLAWCSYAVCAKRWHDRNKSGWWSLIGFIPLFGALWLPIELGFLPGTRGYNDYGPEPQ